MLVFAFNISILGTGMSEILLTAVPCGCCAVLTSSLHFSCKSGISQQSSKRRGRKSTFLNCNFALLHFHRSRCTELISKVLHLLLEGVSGLELEERELSEASVIKLYDLKTKWLARLNSMIASKCFNDSVKNVLFRDHSFHFL